MKRIKSPKEIVLNQQILVEYKGIFYIGMYVENWIYTCRHSMVTNKNKMHYKYKYPYKLKLQGYNHSVTLYKLNNITILK